MGKGEVAAKMVVPEKRKAEAFLTPNLSKFYGGLEKPIILTEMKRNAPGRFLVRYYCREGRAHSYDGRAVVETTLAQGKPLIHRITALNGC